MEHIHIDVRMARHTGIGRYLRGLICHLPHGILGHRYTLIGSKETSHYFPCHYDFVCVDVPIYSWSEQIALLRVTRHSDCLHSPHYNAPLLWKRKLIVTIHDLIHLHFPEQLPSRAAALYAQTMLPLIARKADAIIAVSQYTKDDLVKTLHVPPDKVFVVHHGIDPSFLSLNHSAAVFENPNPYFLYVGLLKTHKNVGVLLEAFKRLREKTGFNNLKLVLIGKPDAKQQMVCKWLRTIQENRFIALRSDVTDDELIQAYRGAAALVFPSRYEGFGFPLLEAMASQIPIIASNAASVPEILGERAGLYFDPDSVSELLARMEVILSKADLRKQLVLEGKKRLAQFGWAEASKRTQDVYESVLGSN